MDSTITLPTDPTNILTFLLGQPETSSFEDGYNMEPTWFSTSLHFLVSAKSPATRWLTFERVKHLIKSLASGLVKEGLLPGDRLILISPENIYMPVMLLATIAAGGIFVGRSPDCTAAQQAIIFKHCEPTFILAYKGSEKIVVQAARLADSNARLFSYDDDWFDCITPPSQISSALASWGQLLDDAGAASFHWPTCKTMADLETTALIIYTTGTTSDPKGVELTHRSLLNTCTYYRYMFSPSDHQGSWLHNYSTAFPGASAIFLMALKSRNRLIVYDFPTLDPDNLLRSISLHRCNIVFATKQALDAMPARKSHQDLSHTSMVCTGGAVVPQVTRQAVNHFFDKSVFRVTYAITEAGGFVSIEDQGSTVGPSTNVGKLLPHAQGRIVDSDGNKVIESQPGNLQWRTPSVMKGYWRNAEATQKTLLEDGWIDSGDIGFFDTEERLHLIGRAKEILKVKGRPVNPSGIEETLIKMYGIVLACVVGIQDQKGEDLPKAYIVSDWDLAKPVNEEDVHAFMKEKMSDDHRLTGGVEFIDGDWLPYGGNGKVLRREVQKRAQEKYDAEQEALVQHGNTPEGGTDNPAAASQHGDGLEESAAVPAAAGQHGNTMIAGHSAAARQPRDILRQWQQAWKDLGAERGDM